MKFSILFQIFKTEVALHKILYKFQVCTTENQLNTWSSLLKFQFCVLPYSWPVRSNLLISFPFLLAYSMKVFLTFLFSSFALFLCILHLFISLTVIPFCPSYCCKPQYFILHNWIVFYCLYTYNILFICCWTFSFSQVLTIGNNTSSNMGVHGSRLYFC